MKYGNIFKDGKKSKRMNTNEVCEKFNKEGNVKIQNQFLKNN